MSITRAKFDVIIIGAGPAGLTAGIFARRAGLNVLCIERLVVGGQASLSVDVQNYPGFSSIPGADLTELMFKHAQGLGVNFEFDEVSALKQIKAGFSVKTKRATYQAKNVIIACGCKTRKLGLNDEQRLTGKGVSYCASCDGNFFKNKVVAIVGGGDTAFQDVEYLSHIAKKIYLINRTEQFKAGEVALNKAKQNKKLTILTNSNVVGLNGEQTLKSIDVNIDGVTKNLKVDGIFFAIGSVPYLNFVKFDLSLDSYGYIKVDETMQTSVKNLYACGDIISKNFRQIITACAEGAIAGNSCVKG